MYWAHVSPFELLPMTNHPCGKFLLRLELRLLNAFYRRYIRFVPLSSDLEPRLCLSGLGRVIMLAMRTPHACYTSELRYTEHICSDLYTGLASYRQAD